LQLKRGGLAISSFFVPYFCLMNDALTHRCTVDSKLISRLLQWADSHFANYCLLRNHNIQYPYGGFPDKFYAGHSTYSLSELASYTGPNTLIGIIGYDYKNQVEKLQSINEASVECPETSFFEAELIVEFLPDGIALLHPKSASLLEDFLQFRDIEDTNPTVKVFPLTSKEGYLQAVASIQQHIVEGDMYELNYCMGFEFAHADWNPIQGFLDLMEASPMPFSAFFKSGNISLICASPERFLKKEGNILMAQPIKGTSRRGKTPEEDSLLREALLHSEKERAENLMIVDLMRNDLAKVSKTGSVTVPELFGVYPFKSVFQMISTVQSQMETTLSLQDILHATFPMGSMTGAPKIKCMELIDKYENFKRGWFSGALGIVEGNGNFDFNVVIRSIIFDCQSRKGYFAVGSAITFDADPLAEYEECQLKAAPILKVLGG
jgi:para-aminobenzoate synthetase component I